MLLIRRGTSLPEKRWMGTSQGESPPMISIHVLPPELLPVRLNHIVSVSSMFAVVMFCLRTTSLSEGDEESCRASSSAEMFRSENRIIVRKLLT